MSSEMTEFCRLVRLDKLPDAGLSKLISASAQERLALAARCGLDAVHALTADLHVMPYKGGVRIRGNFDARIEQTCVVTLERFCSDLSGEIARSYLPQQSARAVQAEVAVDPLEEDTDVLVGPVIDIGEIAAETLILQIDPHPRKPDAKFDASEFDALRESAGDGPDNPFSVLRDLETTRKA